MTLLIIGMAIFLGAHSLAIVAPAARARLIERLGPQVYRAAHGLVSLLGFALLVHGFALARQAPIVVYVPPPWLRHVTMLLMLPVFPLLLAAYLPGRISTATKHPMLVAVKTWSVAHLLANGMAADLLLFGGFLAWAVADRISLKRRPAVVRPGAAPRAWHDAAAVLLGLALYGFFVGFAHLRLFGVSPMG